MLHSRRSAKARVLISALAVAACLAMTALVQPDPAVGQAQRRVVAESRFTVTSAALQAELVSLVVDFAPSAWTSLHTHGGQAVNLVLEGEITLRHAGMAMPHRAGQAWTDSTGQVHAAGNTGPGKARLLTNFLLPKGAPQITVIEDSKFEPTIVYEARAPLPALPPEAEIVQQVVDLASGWRGERILDGFAASVVVAGEVTYQIGAQRSTYRAGEAWFAPAGTLVTEENGSHSAAQVFTTYLLPSRIGR
jgi:quercetin dioxygenase-like cupin family protein